MDKKYFDFGPVSIIQIQIGQGLCKKKYIKQICAAVQDIRRITYLDYGVLIPIVNILNSPQLSNFEYKILFFNKDMGSMNWKKNKFLTCDINYIERNNKNKTFHEPVYNFLSIWITKFQKISIKSSFSFRTYLCLYLDELISTHLEYFITIQTIEEMLHVISKRNPFLVDLFRKKYPDYHTKLQSILKAFVKTVHSLQNFEIILEHLYNIGFDKDEDFLLKELILMNKTISSLKGREK